MDRLLLPFCACLSITCVNPLLTGPMRYCNYCDVTSIYSLNSRKSSGHFSYDLGMRLSMAQTEKYQLNHPYEGSCWFISLTPEGAQHPRGRSYKPQHPEWEGDLTNLQLIARWLFWQCVNDVITIHILSIPIPHFQTAVLQLSRSSNKCSCSVQQCDFEQVKLVALLEKRVMDLISPNKYPEVLQELPLAVSFRRKAWGSGPS